MRHPSTLVRDALNYAREAHAGQTRKDGRTPYLFHPVRVFNILRRAHVCHEHYLAAALLHDTVEDCGTEPADLRAWFGPEVASLVLEVTDEPGPSALRKQRQLERAPRLSYGATAIKLADKAANLVDMVERPPKGHTAAQRLAYAEHARQLEERTQFMLWDLRVNLWRAIERAEAETSA